MLQNYRIFVIVLRRSSSSGGAVVKIILVASPENVNRWMRRRLRCKWFRQVVVSYAHGTKEHTQPPRNSQAHFRQPCHCQVHDNASIKQSNHHIDGPFVLHVRQELVNRGFVLAVGNLDIGVLLLKKINPHSGIVTGVPEPHLERLALGQSEGHWISIMIIGTLLVGPDQVALQDADVGVLADGLLQARELEVDHRLVGLAPVQHQHLHPPVDAAPCRLQVRGSCCVGACACSAFQQLHQLR
mmetsp:Transcript_58424/g.190554  ORF Transcript_58424/g.190554 Transcript_58424/m.190554 type:complete len:242 (-) Transcript_58424:137-862(-)